MKKDGLLITFLSIVVLNIILAVVEVIAYWAPGSSQLAWGIWQAEPFIAVIGMLLGGLIGGIQLILGIINAATKKKCAHNFIKMGCYYAGGFVMLITMLLMLGFSYGQSI